MPVSSEASLVLNSLSAALFSGLVSGEWVTELPRDTHIQGRKSRHSWGLREGQLLTTRWAPASHHLEQKSGHLLTPHLLIPQQSQSRWPLGWVPLWGQGRDTPRGSSLSGKLWSLAPGSYQFLPPACHKDHLGPPWRNLRNQLNSCPRDPAQQSGSLGPAWARGARDKWEGRDYDEGL